MPNVATGRNTDTAVLHNTFLRQDVYAMLGALLVRPPSVRRLKDLAGLTVLPGLSPAFEYRLQQLKQAAQRSDAARVSREYADVFIGLGRGEVMPYASWYLGNRLMARPLVRMRGDLAGMYICLQKNVHEFEDHAAAMCEAMALILATPKISAHRRNQFFNTHLAPWMSRFFDDLQNAPSADFYSVVGRLGGHFMRLEEQRQQVPA